LLTVSWQDHAVDHTAENAYYGQAGFYILHDNYERSLNLPSGKYDVPLGLSAKYYNKDGTLWDPEANGEKTSVYGDVIHVNGAPWPYFDVEPRKYRFRLLNTGISRTYKLYLELDDQPGKKLTYTVIGSDCGLLEKPVDTTDIYISIAERWEIVVDFTQYAGKNITVRNTPGIAADSDYTGTDRVMSKLHQDFTTCTAYSNTLPRIPRREEGLCYQHNRQRRTSQCTPHCPISTQQSWS
jgi:bilirubin oxidase